MEAKNSPSLLETWKFWIVFVEDNKYNCMPVVIINEIATFWKNCFNLFFHDEQTQIHTVALFKDNIEPKLEDQANNQNGRLRLPDLDPEHQKILFILTASGELDAFLEKNYSIKCNGIYRNQKGRFEIWFKNLIKDPDRESREIIKFLDAKIAESKDLNFDLNDI